MDEEVVDMPTGTWVWDDGAVSLTVLRDFYEVRDEKGEFDGAGLRISRRTETTSPTEYEHKHKEPTEQSKFNENEAIMNSDHNKKSNIIAVLSITDIFTSIAFYLDIKSAIYLASTCKQLWNIMEDDYLWKTLSDHHFGHIDNLIEIECSNYYPPRENNHKNRYIIRRSMRWGRHSREYQLSNDGRTATKMFNIESPISNKHNVFADIGLLSGKHYWEIHMDRYNWSAWAPYLLIGIVPADGVIDGQYIGWEGNGCSCTSNGTYLYEGEVNKSEEGSFIYHKDTVGVYLDLDTFSIKFFLNGEDLRWAYRDLNKEGKWKLPIYPAVGTAHSKDQFTINFNVPPPKLNNDNLFGVLRWDPSGTKQYWYL